MAPQPSSRPPSALRTERDRQGLRLKDVADTAGCSISTVSTAEAGYWPPLGTQERIASALGASSGSFWPTGAETMLGVNPGQSEPMS